MSFRVAVLGGGAWGTALAMQMRRAGHDVRLWARDAETVAAIRRGENPRYLPGVKIDAGIEATTDSAEALDGAGCVLAVTPAQALRDVLETVGRDVPSGVPLVLCAKGIEHETGLLLSQIAGEFLPGNPVAALSGPSFATDLAKGLPTAVVIAARDEALAASLAQSLLDRTLPLLFDRRPGRGRDRRRAEERLRHRRRRGHRRGAGRQRAGRDGDARLRRAEAHRPGLRRRARDGDGAFRPRRPAAHLRFGAVAQLRLWAGARTRREP